MHMNIKTTDSYDGIALTFAHSEISSNKPWLVFILPFGLPLKVAEAFFAFFESNYNVVTWELRSILGSSETKSQKSDFSIEKHVADLSSVLTELNICKCDLVGYCSGAGIAMMAVNSHSEKFNSLILVNGEFTLLNDAACLTQFNRDVSSLYPIAASDIKTAQFILDKLNATSDANLPPGFNLPFSKAGYFHRLAVNYIAYRAVDFPAQASLVKQKTLLITAANDEQCNVNSSMKIKKMIANSDIYIDPEGDHYGIVRHESNTLAVIRDYLKEWR